MKLKLITEGISYLPNSGVDLAQIEQRLQGEAKVNQIDLMQFLEANGTFVFQPQDSPNDIIKIEPFQKSVNLNIAPTDPEALESFQGARIYYAYRVADPADIDLDFYKAKQEPPILRALSAISPPRGKFRRLNNLDSLSAKHQELLRDLNSKSVQYHNDAHRAQVHGELQGDIDVIKQVEGLLKTNGVESVDGLRKILAKSTRRYNTGKKKLLPALKNALGHIIKHPRNAHEAQLRTTILDQIINKVNVIGQWGDGHDVFPDIIAYPTSTVRAGETQSFNQEFANRISEAYGGVPVIEIAKRPREDTTDYFESTIDRAALQRFANTIHNKYLTTPPGPALAKKRQITRKTQLKYLGAVRYNETILPTDPRWPKLWADKEFAKLQKGLERTPVGLQPTYKSLAGPSGSMGSKRRYVQLFGKSAGVSQYNSDDQLRGKNVLIVDDNIQYGGTMETLHKLVNEASPQSITVFVPFYFGKF